MSEGITCQECESEFKISSGDNIPPEFCPFCGEKLTYDDKDLDEWYEEDEIMSRGC